jgi:hypothetical protein
MTVSYQWRGDFTSAEANAPHAECFRHPVLSDDEWDWREQVGTRLVEVAAREARAAGCEWLHVDFEDHLRASTLTPAGSSPPTPA